MNEELRMCGIFGAVLPGQRRRLFAPTKLRVGSGETLNRLPNSRYHGSPEPIVVILWLKPGNCV